LVAVALPFFLFGPSIAGAGEVLEAFGAEWRVEPDPEDFFEGTYTLVVSRGGTEVLREEMEPGRLVLADIDGLPDRAKEVVYIPHPGGSSAIIGGLVVFTSPTERQFVSLDACWGVGLKDLDSDGVAEITTYYCSGGPASAIPEDRTVTAQVLSWKDRTLRDVTDRFPTSSIPETTKAEEAAATMEGGHLAASLDGPEGALRSYYTLLSHGHAEAAYSYYKIGNRGFESWKSIYVDPVGCVGLQSVDLLSVKGDTGRVQVDVCVHDLNENVIWRWKGPVTMEQTSPGRWVMTAKSLERAGQCQPNCKP